MARCHMRCATNDIRAGTNLWVFVDSCRVLVQYSRNVVLVEEVGWSVSPRFLSVYTVERSKMRGLSPEEMREELLEALEAAAPAHDVDVVDVEVVGSAKARTIRVRIDHADEDADPITLDEVSAQSGWISDLIDELDPIEGSFMLEVSSPGLSRPLRRPHDFERFAGEQVSLKLKAAEGRRRYTGTLKGYDEGLVRLSCDDGDVAIPFDEIRSCTIKPTFDDGTHKGAKGRSSAGKR